jgi:hypothetical protein
MPTDNVSAAGLIEAASESRVSTDEACVPTAAKLGLKSEIVYAVSFA